MSIAAEEKSKRKAIKEINHIKTYLNWIAEKEKLLESVQNTEKKARLCSDIEFWHKRSIRKSAEAIAEAQSELSEMLLSVSDREREIMNEIFPYGFENRYLKFSEKRNLTIKIIKDRINSIIKLRQNCFYADDMPIEKKIKNKLFNKEQSVGLALLNESKEGSKTYNEAWNFKKDFDNSDEFTDEEREIIKKCVKCAEEKRDYMLNQNIQIKEIGITLEKQMVLTAGSNKADNAQRSKKSKQ